MEKKVAELMELCRVQVEEIPKGWTDNKHWGTGKFSADCPWCALVELNTAFILKTAETTGGPIETIAEDFFYEVKGCIAKDVGVTTEEMWGDE